GGEQGEKREAAKHHGRSENQERLAPVHVVLATSVNLNPLGPVSFFLDSPPDLLHDSTGGVSSSVLLCRLTRVARVGSSCSLISRSGLSSRMRLSGVIGHLSETA